MPPLFSWAASRMCAFAGMTGRPSAPLALKSGVSNSFDPVSGAPEYL